MHEHIPFDGTQEMLTSRSKAYEFVLYPDCDEHKSILLELNRGHTFVGILHDKDTNVDGEAIKPHWHILYRTKSQRWGRAICNELLVPPHLTRRVRDWDAACLYLTHTGFPDKHQYDTEELFGPLTADVINLHEGNTDINARVLALLALIESQNRALTVRDIIRIACENGYFSDLCRIMPVVRDLAEIHNHEDI